jgi:DNA mismatch repair protein MutS
MNEPFSSTTAQDAMDMADRVLSMFVDAGARVLCVTHISGFASGKLVNMTAQIDPVNHQRLYRIVRAPAETHAYADEIARKYSLTYREIKERVQHGI